MERTIELTKILASLPVAVTHVFLIKCLTGEKDLSNFYYRTNLSENKTNVWEGRNESDWSIFPEWFTCLLKVNLLVG